MMRPAILGGPVPETALPISQPTLPDFDAYTGPLREIFESRSITNDRWVRRLEEAAAEYLGVPEVVSLANATSGLILVAKLLGIKGKVLLPSFTFPATLHALLWNGLEPLLVDCDPDSFNIDPEDAERRIASGVTAIFPVYIFGNAPDWARIDALRRRHGLRALSDAAHAFGTRAGGKMAGSFADAEIFSFAPTKVTVSGEGGLVATRDAALARELRIARNYGNPGDYDCTMAGLNARQSEIHALLGYLSMRQTELHIARREALVNRYRSGLAGLEGLRFQRIDPSCRSTHNYFAVRIDAERFGLSNAEMKTALERNRIHTKIYFHPPLHRQSRFGHLPGLRGEFPNTDQVCREVLCLPLYSHMRDDDVDRVVETIRSLRAEAPSVRAAVNGAD